jgi:hypothetical protein
MVIPSASEAISRTMSGIEPFRLARLARLDEPCVLSEAASVEEQRHAEPITDAADGVEVLERDGLSAAGVVRDRHEHDRDVGRAAR